MRDSGHTVRSARSGAAKRTPDDARRSRFGVRTTGCPAHDSESPRHWSAVTNSTFDRGTREASHGAASVRGPGIPVVASATRNGAASVRGPGIPVRSERSRCDARGVLRYPSHAPARRGTVRGVTAAFIGDWCPSLNRLLGPSSAVDRRLFSAARSVGPLDRTARRSGGPPTLWSRSVLVRSRSLRSPLRACLVALAAVRDTRPATLAAPCLFGRARCGPGYPPADARRSVTRAVAAFARRDAR